MTNLVIHLEASLKNPDDNIDHQPDTVLNRDWFSPCECALLGTTKTGHDHVVEYIITKLGSFVMNNLTGTNTPSPDLVFY